MSYDYNFFYGLEKRVVTSTFPEWEPQFVNEAYDNWREHFNHTASILYRAQFEAHEEMVGRMFCKRFGIGDMEETQSPEYRNLWNEFSLENGLSEHRRQYEGEMWMESARNNGDFRSIGDALNDLLERITGDTIHPRSPIIETLIMRLWFNTELNNSPEMAKELCDLPYDMYLKTAHWKRVRAAMMIAHRARCQSTMCINGDSYWFGFEHYLHVHHVTYKNRGNERFEDLRLVCKDCHKYYHDTKENIFPEWSNGVYGLMTFEYPEDRANES